MCICICRCICKILIVAIHFNTRCFRLLNCNKMRATTEHLRHCWLLPWPSLLFIPEALLRPRWARFDLRFKSKKEERQQFAPNQFRICWLQYGGVGFYGPLQETAYCIREVRSGNHLVLWIWDICASNGFKIKATKFGENKGLLRFVECLQSENKL